MTEDKTKDSSSEKIAPAHVEDTDSIATMEELSKEDRATGKCEEDITDKEDGAPGKCEEDITDADGNTKTNNKCTDLSTKKTDVHDHRLKHRWLTMLQRIYYKMTCIANLGPNDTLEALQEPTGTQAAAIGVEQEHRMIAFNIPSQ